MRKLVLLYVICLIGIGQAGARGKEAVPAGEVAVIRTDTLWVKQPQVPVLIDRADNVLFYLRIDGTVGDVLNEIRLTIAGEEAVKGVKLYYGGTESAERRGKNFFAPVQYISRNAPGKTRAAHPAYSVKLSETNIIGREVLLTANQRLFPGLNYFWVSVEMQPTASIRSTLKAEVVSARLNGEPLPVVCGENTPIRRLGVGVRHAGDDGAAAYRIPGLVTSNAGTLQAVYDIRYNNSADLQEHVDIGLSRSTDGGQHWEAMRVVMSFGESGGLPRAQNGVGDPAILVDRNTGTLWVIAAWTHGLGNGRAWNNSQQGIEKERTAQLVLSKSDDDGKSWSQPINITPQVKDPSWYFLLQGPGNGITLEDGTLVFASQYIGADRIPNAGIIYSRDHGATWHIHHPARTNTTEAQVVELEPGVLMLNMRDNRGGSRAVSVTKDMGKTWTEHVSSRRALPEPVCMASLIRIKAADNLLGKEILLFSNPNTTGDRKNITIKASLDDGITWLEANQLLLDEEPGWGYSCLTRIDRETVGILYEGSAAHLVFQAIPLTDIVKTR